MSKFMNLGNLRVKEAIRQGIKVDYPCSDHDMEYDEIDHEYYLTDAYLIQMGLNKLGYIELDTQERNQLRIDSSRDVKQFVMDTAFTNFEFYNFMIATGWGFLNLSQYLAREKYKEALLEQARYRLVNGDIRDTSGYDIGDGQNIGIKQLRNEFRHLSQKTQSILKGMGLTYNGPISDNKFWFYRQNKENY